MDKPCLYNDICVNEGMCITCDKMELFEQDNEKFTCYECEGESDCDFAYDIKNLNGGCIVNDS